MVVIRVGASAGIGCVLGDTSGPKTMLGENETHDRAAGERAGGTGGKSRTKSKTVRVKSKISPMESAGTPLTSDRQVTALTSTQA